MKRLRRFNESKSDIDYDYVYQCFADLLDDEKAQIREFDNGHVHYITIDLKINPFSPERRYTSQSSTIEKSKFIEYINDVKSNTELLQEVEVALNRLTDEYPEYRVSFDVFAYSIHINIFAGEEKKEQYPF